MRGKDNARSGGQILIDQLSIHGVRDVFCVPGESYLAALDAFLIDTGEALSALPHLAINDDQARRLRSGNPIILRGRDAPLPAPEAYATAGGELIAIGAIEEGEFRPKRVFA